MAARLNFVAGLLLAFAAGCCGPVNGLYPPTDAAHATEIFIYNNHWHTGFVLSRDSLSSTLTKYLARFADASYVEIGWGDEAFYRADKGTSGLAARAGFCSRGTVLHVAGLTRDPHAHYREMVVDLYRVRISEIGRRRLMAFLECSFAVDARGNAIELQPGLYDVSYFYLGRGHYGALHTCNHWVADGLRTTGFPITPFYAALADNVGWQVRVFGSRYQADMTVLRQ